MRPGHDCIERLGGVPLGDLSRVVHMVTLALAGVSETAAARTKGRVLLTCPGSNHMANTSVLPPATAILCLLAFTILCTTPSLMRWARWLRFWVWSKIVAMTQSAAAQNLSCAPTSAKPPGASTLMLADALLASGRVTL